MARGESGAAPVGAVFVRADRDRPGAFDDLAAARFDAVVDVARQPGQVRRAVAALEPLAARYVFVSSCSVYADHSQPGEDESAAVLPALDGDVMASTADYGSSKVACELAVLDRFGPDRTLLVRPGLIGGPGDPSGRSSYWPWRFARPSNPERRVLVPEDGGAPSQVIDVRDLADWTVASAAGGLNGTFNAVGPVLPLGGHLATAQSVAGGDPVPVPVPAQWLTEHGVGEWAGPRSLPLWLADPAFAGFCARDADAAVGAGLHTRPLHQTLTDVLAAGSPLRDDGTLAAGLTDEEERELFTML